VQVKRPFTPFGGPSSWGTIERVADGMDPLSAAHAALEKRATELGHPPKVALLGSEGVVWLLGGDTAEPALLWSDPACLIEVIDGRATVLGALLAGAARCEVVSPPWDWTRRQVTAHEGADSVIGRLPSTGRAPRELRHVMLRTIAEVLRDQLRFHDYQESQLTDVHVRWSSGKRAVATTRTYRGTYEVHDGAVEGDALELRMDEHDLPRVLRREALVTDLVLEGRTALHGNVEAVSFLPEPQF
jgi:hypothetical protein